MLKRPGAAPRKAHHQSLAELPPKVLPREHPAAAVFVPAHAAPWPGFATQPAAS